MTSSLDEAEVVAISCHSNHERVGASCYNVLMIIYDSHLDSIRGRVKARAQSSYVHGVRCSGSDGISKVFQDCKVGDLSRPVAGKYNCRLAHLALFSLVGCQRCSLRRRLAYLSRSVMTRITWNLGLDSLFQVKIWMFTVLTDEELK